MPRDWTTQVQKPPETAWRKPARHRFWLRHIFRDPRPTQQGVTLIELLCVMVIIAILFSMLMPAVAKAYRRAKAMQEEWDEGAVASMLTKEVQGYCAGHPVYQFNSKDDFTGKCGLNPKCKDWIYASRTEFVPFNNLDPTNKVVVTFHYGPKYSQVDAFTKGQLTLPPRER